MDNWLLYNKPLYINYSRSKSDIVAQLEGQSIPEEIKQEWIQKNDQFKDWMAYIQHLKELEKLRDLKVKREQLITDMHSGKIKPKFNDSGNYIKDINTL